MGPAALDALLKSQPALWRGCDRYSEQASLPTGFAVLDNALPCGGWAPGGVTELLLDQHGIGEFSLLLPGLRDVTSTDSNTLPKSSQGQGRWAALINPPHIPYAPAFINAGVQLSRLLIIDSTDDTETLWASEQVLRSGLFGAVVTWTQRSNTRQQRRLQLAAESGKSWAIVYRPLHARREHSPVSTRICLEVTDQRLKLDIIKVRAGNPQTIYIEPEEFDASQGAEWPVSSPTMNTHGTNSPD
ncbi:MAG: translesion DNA synthesis-associated protein ImuA [Granulosicoccus sp.]|nr:translesion DNA synthesis-associated protein ImuA [Granulosicoccus sp.]